jgi:cylB protein
MKEPLETAFTGNSRLLQEFQEKMGIQINWQELLTKEETYFIVVIISLVAILLWLLFVKVFSKRK